MTSVPGPAVVLLADGEAHGSRHHVEPFVVLGVAVLGRSDGVRGERTLCHPESVLGGAAVLEDAHLRHRPQRDAFPLARTNDGHLYHDNLLTCVVVDMPSRRRAHTF